MTFCRNVFRRMRRPAASVSSGSNPPLSRRAAGARPGWRGRRRRHSAMRRRSNGSLARAGARAESCASASSASIRAGSSRRRRSWEIREVPPDADSQPEQPVLAAVRDEARGHQPDAEQRLLHSGLYIHSSRERPQTVANAGLVHTLTAPGDRNSDGHTSAAPGATLGRQSSWGRLPRPASRAIRSSLRGKISRLRSKSI